MPTTKLHDFIKKHYFTLPLILIISILTLLGDTGREIFQYNRAHMENGEVWRIITGHFVHSGIEHTLLNLSGVCIFAFLFEDNSTSLKWWITLLAMMVLSSAAYYVIDSHIHWYVGLSGVLHGFFILGAIGEWHNDKVISVVVLAAMIGKLIYGQVYGPPASTAEMIGVPVYENAHFFGGILALIIGTVFYRVLFSQTINKTSVETAKSNDTATNIDNNR